MRPHCDLRIGTGGRISRDLDSGRLAFQVALQHIHRTRAAAWSDRESGIFFSPCRSPACNHELHLLRANGRVPAHIFRQSYSSQTRCGCVPETTEEEGFVRKPSSSSAISEIVREDGIGATDQLACIVGPYPGTPVPVTARLRH